MRALVEDAPVRTTTTGQRARCAHCRVIEPSNVDRSTVLAIVATALSSADTAARHHRSRMRAPAASRLVPLRRTPVLSRNRSNKEAIRPEREPRATSERSMVTSGITK